MNSHGYISQNEHALKIEREGTVNCVKKNLERVVTGFSAAEDWLKSNGNDLLVFADKSDTKYCPPDALEYFLTLIGEKIESKTYEDDLHLWFLKMQRSAILFHLVKNSIEHAERSFFNLLNKEDNQPFSCDLYMAISHTTTANYWLGVLKYSLLFLGKTLHSDHSKEIGGKKDETKRKLTIGYMKERISSQKWETREQFFYAVEDEIPEKLGFKRSAGTIERYFYAHFSDSEQASFDRKSRESKKL